ncbi:MAG: phosphoribosylformylglycinamidine synthase II, partial [Verrucomicrobia bacterium]|nr:phosphoribosylformylglycinamidine synthase II [Verrucomicrobiota bacterium]
FEKWDLPWAQIGVVTDTGQMVVKNHGQIVADIPTRKLANEAPIYHRESREPGYLKTVREFTLGKIPDTNDPVADLKTLLAWPTIASKSWVYRQYDHTVRACSVIRPGSDAAVLRIKEDSLPPIPQNPHSALRTPHSERFIALTVDCNAVYVYLDPYEGGKIAVAEAARNLACTGATPLGITDNLNFGNPHNPEIFYQLQKSVEGLAEACRVFEVPVTGGNVSLYNQSPAGPIDPTPTVAMVGLIEKPEHITTQWFKDEGDVIILLGEGINSEDPLLGLGGSAYLQRIHGLKTGLPPRCDLAQERGLHDAVRALIRSGLIKSAHDCSEGGLAVALAECCVSQQVPRDTPRLMGAEMDLTLLESGEPETSRSRASRSQVSNSRLEIRGQTAPAGSSSEIRLDAWLFGETQSRVIISASASNAEEVLQCARRSSITASRLGTVGGAALKIRLSGGELTWDLRELHDLWWNSIARAMK